MKGLLLKDLLILKLQWKFYILLLGVYIALAITSEASYFFPVLAMMVLVLPMSSFTADEMARWDKFAAALPGGRRAVVDAKYQFLLITILGMEAILLATNLAAYLFRSSEGSSLVDSLLSSLLYGAIGFLVNCALYPVLFKFGTQKSRIVMILVFGGIFGIVAAGAAILELGGGLAAVRIPLPPVAVAVVAAVILVGAWLVSYRLSCRIYENREF